MGLGDSELLMGGSIGALAMFCYLAAGVFSYFCFFGSALLIYVGGVRKFGMDYSSTRFRKRVKVKVFKSG